MLHTDLIKKVRAHARDFNDTIFRKEDITLFLNEAIDRVIQVLPAFNNMAYLVDDDDFVSYLPREYTHLLSTYSVARLYSQDERHYEASTFMNEFELKLDELKERIENGEIEIIDPDTGVPLDTSIATDYVVDKYFSKHRRGEVEGVY